MASREAKDVEFYLELDAIPAEVENSLLRYLDGYRTESIAKKYNLTVKQVYQLKLAWGICRSSSLERPLTPEEWKLVHARYQHWR